MAKKTLDLTELKLGDRFIVLKQWDWLDALQPKGVGVVTKIGKATFEVTYFDPLMQKESTDRWCLNTGSYIGNLGMSLGRSLTDSINDKGWSIQNYNPRRLRYLKERHAESLENKSLQDKIKSANWGKLTKGEFSQIVNILKRRGALPE